MIYVLTVIKHGQTEPLISEQRAYKSIDQAIESFYRISDFYNANILGETEYNDGGCFFYSEGKDHELLGGFVFVQLNDIPNLNGTARF